jgi:hypothetical protein
MTCTLCEQPIEPYRAELHQLHLTEERTVYLCDACAQRLLTWQGERLARLFPTRALKRLRGSGRSG